MSTRITGSVTKAPHKNAYKPADLMTLGRHFDTTVGATSVTRGLVAFEFAAVSARNI